MPVQRIWFGFEKMAPDDALDLRQEQAAYGQVEKLVTPDDWKSDLGRYVTSLGAALIEWEEGCEDLNG